MTRTEIINYLIRRRDYKSYLEIGVSAGRNFQAIKCRKKIGIDPDTKSKATTFFTSDEFFLLNGVMFDIIFIDGNHEAPQARRDLINSWAHLHDGGCIVMHDTNPATEEITIVPRQTKEWCGDVYKVVAQINWKHKLFTFKDDHGVTVLRKDPGQVLELTDEWISWTEFDKWREDILNLITADEVIQTINAW